MSQAALIEVLQDRCSTYALLARIYSSEPSSDFLRALVDTVPSDDNGEVLGEQANRFPAFIRRLAGEDLGRVLTDLRSEYASLFLNAGRKPVYPYESVYTSPEKLLMQRAHDEVVQAYAEAGLSRSASFRDPEDHIAMELGFMAHLCEQTLAALEAGDVPATLTSLQQQSDFLEKHLLVWVPELCRDLSAAATSDFYRGAAALTAELMSIEPETIRTLMSELQDKPQ